MDKNLRKQLTPLYEQIGAIVQSSQQMEMGIAYSLTLLKRIGSKEFDDEAFENSMDVFSKKTLGRLIRELKKHIDLDNSAEKALKLALDERNFVIHRFFNDNIEQFVTPEGRKSCLNRIRQARHNIHPGFMVLDGAVQSLMRVSGLNPAQIVKEVESGIEI